MTVWQELAANRPQRRSWQLTRAVRRDLRNGLLFVSPWLVGLCVFTLYPILASFYYSFTVYDIISPPQFAGLANYQDLLTTDPLFWKAVRNTLYYVAVAVPLYLCIALAVALLLNMKLRGMAVYRTLFFLPSIVPDVASAMLWAWILNPQFGLLNALLRGLGIPTVGWLSDPNWSKPALILIGLWAFGSSMVIFLAALQDVPEALYEAAELDGAGLLRKTWNVTLPMITPTIFFNLVLGMIGAFQYFTTAFVLSQGTGGPASSTLFYSLLLYNNAFSYFKMGYSSAMAWLLFAFVFLLTWLVFKSANRWVYYEGENA
ncbi:MAG TPA: sugar ABC transporter permease [Caldilineaceae bacterium]|nr:sugar ABC transporter permease [Caldilineaceae bacterium]